MNSSYPLNAQCSAALSEQIAMELEAFYAYHALGSFFEHPDKAFFNVAKYFHTMANEEAEHAEKFKNYLILRGIYPSYRDLKSFNPDKNMTLQQAFELALRFEQGVFASIRNIHTLASTAEDGHLTTFLEDIFYQDQLEAEQEINGYLTLIKRLGSGIGEFLFDKDALKR